MSLTYLGQRGKEPCVLILVLPFEILQEVYRTTQGVEEVYNRGTMSFRAFGLELTGQVSSRQKSAESLPLTLSCAMAASTH